MAFSLLDFAIPQGDFEDQELLFEPAYFFGRVPVGQAIPEGLDFDEEYFNLFRALSDQTHLNISFDQFRHRGLKQLHIMLNSRGAFIRSNMTHTTRILGTLESEFVLEGDHFVVRRGTDSYNFSLSSAEMFHEIHDLACFLIFGVREADNPRLGNDLTPDYYREGLVMEMKTYRQSAFAIPSLRAQCQKYASYAAANRIPVTVCGIAICEDMCVLMNNPPAFVIRNLDTHGPFIIGLIEKSRELFKDTYESEFFTNKYWTQVAISLPADGFGTIKNAPIDPLYIDAERLAFASTENNTIPLSLEDHLKSVLTQMPKPVDTPREFLIKNKEGANRTKGRACNIPLLYKSEKTYRNLWVDFSHKKDFSRFFLDCYSQALTENKILETYKQVIPHKRHQKPLPKKKVSELYEDMTKPESKAKSDSLKKQKTVAERNLFSFELVASEVHRSYLLSRGRSLKSEIKSAKHNAEKKDSKWFAIDSEFSAIEDFIDYDWLAEERHVEDEFEDLNHSDNALGCKEIWQSYTKTRLFGFCDILSRIYTEIEISVKHYHKDRVFEIKEVAPGLYVLISSKGSYKPIFVQIAHDSRYKPMVGLMPDDKFETSSSGFTIYDSYTYHVDRLANWISLPEKIFAVLLVQAECDRITFNDCSRSPALKRTAAIMLSMLEANEQTQLALSNIRYAGMECLSGRKTINPFKILDKFDHFPRTLFGAWVIKRVIESTQLMIQKRPKMLARTSNDELQQDLVEGYICWMTMMETNSALVAMNSWYVHSLVELVATDDFQSCTEIIQKLFQAESSLRTNEDKEMNYGQRPFAYSTDFGVMQSFDRSFCTWSVTQRINSFKKKTPDFLNACKNKIRANLAKVTYSQICTLKSSVKIVQGPEELKGFVKSKVCLNMLEHLDTIARGSIMPFDHIEKCLVFLEDYGNYISVFKKIQKGLREILILSFPMRILQKLMEVIAVSIGSFSKSEMLTNPKLKEKVIAGHRAVSAKMISNNSSHSSSYSSCDATTWCQGLTSTVIFYFLCQFIPEELRHTVARIMNLMTAKRLALPKKVMERFQNYVIQKTADTQKPMCSKLENLYMGLENGRCFNKGRSHLINRSNMGQGILHTPSSILHDVALSGLIKFCRMKFNKDVEMHITHQVSSDDSGFIITSASKTEGLDEKLSDLNSLICKFITTAYPLFSAKISDPKSTIDCKNPIYEFNSVWHFANFVAALAMKQIRSCFAVRMVSFDRRIDEMSNTRRSLANFGASPSVLGCVQIAQARHHYRCLGLFSQFSDHMKGLLEKTMHPVMGYFPFEPEVLCGLLGTSYAFSRLLTSNQRTREVQNMIFSDPAVSVKENGQPTLNIAFTQNSMANYLKFSKKVQDFEEKIFPEGWREVVEENPFLMFDKFPTQQESVYLDIFKKIDTKRMSESFVTDGAHQVLGSIAYIFQDPCISVIDPEGHRRISFTDLCDLDRVVTVPGDYSHELEESYEIANEIVASFSNCRTEFVPPRPAVRQKLMITSVQEALRVSLYSVCLRFWSGQTDNDVIRNFVLYQNKYNWIRNTFQETMQATQKDAVALLNILAVRAEKTTSVQFLGPKAQGYGLSNILTSYAMNSAPNIRRYPLQPLVVVANSSMLDIVGCLTRLCLKNPMSVDVTEEALQVFDAAYKLACTWRPTLTKELFLEALMSSTSSIYEKSLIFGFICILFPDRAVAEAEKFRSFQFFEHSEKNPDQTWGYSILYLRYMGLTFRVHSRGDSMTYLECTKQAKDFILTPSESSKFLKKLGRAGIKTYYPSETGQFSFSLLQDEPKLRLPKTSSLRIRSEVFNMPKLRGPVKLSFFGFKVRIDNMSQTKKPSFTVLSIKPLNGTWMNNLPMSSYNLGTVPEFFKCLFQAYMESFKEEVAPPEYEDDDREEQDDDALDFLNDILGQDSDDEDDQPRTQKTNYLDVLKDFNPQMFIDQAKVETELVATESEQLALNMDRMDLLIDPELIRRLEEAENDKIENERLICKFPDSIEGILLGIWDDLSNRSSPDPTIQRIWNLPPPKKERTDEDSAF